MAEALSPYFQMFVPFLKPHEGASCFALVVVSVDAVAVVAAVVAVALVLAEALLVVEEAAAVVAVVAVVGPSPFQEASMESLDSFLLWVLVAELGQRYC